jgi:hypothetical protein
MNEHEAGLLADDLDEEMYFQVQSCVLDWLLKGLQGSDSCSSGHAGFLQAETSFPHRQ